MTPRPNPRAPGLVSVEIRREQDVVLARQRARRISELLGFQRAEATGVATAVSEIARNAWRYASGGRVDFAVAVGPPAALSIRVRDEGGGIADLDAILEGRYASRTGMGLGITGSRRLVDGFEIETGPGGTAVTLRKELPPGAPAPDLARIGEALARARTLDPLDELTTQNQELLRTLDDLRARERDLVALNQELEDTNRGVVALYAELDEKADYLRRASELKSRFLSNMSHEFRTPLNTVIAFSRLLLEQSDGPLNEEQQRQLGFMKNAAEGMLELVNDLLDLARVEAGKTIVRKAPFGASELFGALRGMLRPLLAGSAVDLVFDRPVDIPTLDTDEGKVSQILRNFISNALKFTERGEVRVSARAHGDRVVFSVADTGIGIAPEDQERIFQEYTQVESSVQKRVKGTGLGLPLSRKLAQLLGGRIAVQSEVGVGSVFTLDVPVAYEGPTEIAIVPVVSRLPDPTRHPLLVVEDNPETVFIYEKYLKGTPFQVVPASSTAEARRVLEEVRPVAAVLDIMLAGESTWTLLTEMKANPMTKGIPIYVVTIVDSRNKAKALGADDYAEKPLDRAWLLERLERAASPIPRERVVVVDDDDASRYILRDLLTETRFDVVEATDGVSGIALARSVSPAAIFLDLEMPGLHGEQVLAALRADPATRAVPVIIYTSSALDGAARARLSGAAAFLSKETPSRGAALKQVRDALGRATHLATREGERRDAS